MSMFADASAVETSQNSSLLVAWIMHASWLVEVVRGGSLVVLGVASGAIEIASVHLFTHQQYAAVAVPFLAPPSVALRTQGPWQCSGW